MKTHEVFNQSTPRQDVDLFATHAALRVFPQGNASIEGAMVTGLNVKLGSNVWGSDAGPLLHVQYHSCNVAQALARFAHLQLVSNAWTDSWPEN